MPTVTQQGCHRPVHTVAAGFQWSKQKLESPLEGQLRTRALSLPPHCWPKQVTRLVQMQGMRKQILPLNEKRCKVTQQRAWIQGAGENWRPLGSQSTIPTSGWIQNTNQHKIQKLVLLELYPCICSHPPVFLALTSSKFGHGVVIPGLSDSTGGEGFCYCQ